MCSVSIYNWFRKSICDSNQFCPYCGRFIGEGSNIKSNKEHLIGREFVPNGSFDNPQNFNFIFRACEEDNSRKSDYERHVSSITIINSIDKETPKEIVEIAKNKANNDYHPVKKGVKIIDSRDKFNLNYNGQNLNMSVSLIGPPQLYNSFVENLAFMQMQGFYSLITTHQPYDKNKISILPPQYFTIIGSWPKSDWGNKIITFLTEKTLNWECFANLDTANGYYKIVVRHAPETKAMFWALEWNKSCRVAGFIGRKEDIDYLCKDIPGEDWKLVGKDKESTFHMKKEIPLEKDEDKLFIGTVYGNV